MYLVVRKSSKALEGVAPEQAVHDAKATAVVVLSSLERMGLLFSLICGALLVHMLPIELIEESRSRHGRQRNF